MSIFFVGSGELGRLLSVAKHADGLMLLHKVVPELSDEFEIVHGVVRREHAHCVDDGPVVTRFGDELARLFRNGRHRIPRRELPLHVPCRQHIGDRRLSLSRLSEQQDGSLPLGRHC